ncbi:unnamed protein product [Lampetra planeri]
MRLPRGCVPAAEPSPRLASAHGAGGPDGPRPGQGAVSDPFSGGATGVSNRGPLLSAASIPVTGGGPDGDWASPRTSPGRSADPAAIVGRRCRKGLFLPVHHHIRSATVSCATDSWSSSNWAAMSR